MKNKKLSSEEIKQIELNLLLKLDEICKKYKLRYYLCGGTLLGAVRHKGFIPWDDDIDVLMPREDFEKLLRLEKKQKQDAFCIHPHSGTSGKDQSDIHYSLFSFNYITKYSG